MIQHYFVSAWIPNNELNNHFSLRKLREQDIYLLGFSTPATTIPAGTSGTLSADFYVGPKDIKRLEAIAPYLDLTIDFGFYVIGSLVFQVLYSFMMWSATGDGQLSC